MASLREMDAEERAWWEAWLARLAPGIREETARHPPNLLYRIRRPGRVDARVLIIDYGSDGRCVVAVSSEHNLVSHDHAVLGVPLNLLEECDLPGADEPAGEILDRAEAEAAIAGLEGKECEVERILALEAAAERKLRALRGEARKA